MGRIICREKKKRRIDSELHDLNFEPGVLPIFVHDYLISIEIDLFITTASRIHAAEEIDSFNSDFFVVDCANPISNLVQIGGGTRSMSDRN